MSDRDPTSPADAPTPPTPPPAPMSSTADQAAATGAAPMPSAPPTPPMPPGPATALPVPPWAPPAVHERASLACGLGIVGLLGACLWGFGLLLSPFALAFGISARREIASSPQAWRGDGYALTGIVLGAIGTTLLILALVALVVVAVLIATGAITSTGS